MGRGEVGSDRVESAQLDLDRVGSDQIGSRRGWISRVGLVRSGRVGL